jgi:hypothetical protein
MKCPAPRQGRRRACQPRTSPARLRYLLCLFVVRSSYRPHGSSTGCDTLLMADHPLSEYLFRGWFGWELHRFTDKVDGSLDPLGFCHTVSVLFDIGGFDRFDRLSPLRQHSVEIQRWVVFDHNLRHFLGVCNRVLRQPWRSRWRTASPRKDRSRRDWPGSPEDSRTRRSPSLQTMRSRHASPGVQRPSRVLECRRRSTRYKDQSVR